MRHDLTPTPDEPHDHPVGGSSRAVDALAGLAAGYHAMMRRALAAYRRAASEDVAGLAGLTADLVLELDLRLPVPVVRQLEQVSARLDVMPDCGRVYETGLIEFHDLATIVRAGRLLSGPALAELDRWAAVRAAHLARTGLLHLLEGDVEDRAAQLRAPGWASRQERRAEHGSEVRIQQDFDGGGLLVASLTAVELPTVATSIETVAGPPVPDQPRPRQRAAALVAICEHALVGTDLDPAPPTITDTTTSTSTTGPVRGEVRIPRRPRPRITLVVDVASCTADRFAQVQRVTGLRASPTLSARLADTLAGDAELLVQLSDGARPLTQLRAGDIPDAVRRAVIARDRGCRAPGCHAPPSRCDVHHLVARADGGTHDPDNLILLCRVNHRDVDRWQVTHDPTTATVTWRHLRSGRRYRTVPHGSRPPPARPDDVPLAPWEAPPIPPPPGDPPGPSG